MNAFGNPYDQDGFDENVFLQLLSEGLEPKHIGIRMGCQDPRAGGYWLRHVHEKWGTRSDAELMAKWFSKKATTQQSDRYYSVNVTNDKTVLVLIIKAVSEKQANDIAESNNLDYYIDGEAYELDFPTGPVEVVCEYCCS